MAIYLRIGEGSGPEVEIRSTPKGNKIEEADKSMRERINALEKAASSTNVIHALMNFDSTYKMIKDIMPKKDLIEYDTQVVEILKSKYGGGEIQ